MEVTVDDVLAFRGEVREASGAIVEQEQHGLVDCETILFTEDEVVLNRVLRVVPFSQPSEPSEGPLRRTLSSVVSFGKSSNSRNGLAAADGGPVAYPSNCPRAVTSICFVLQSTWGDPSFVGLSALRLRDITGSDVTALIDRCFVARPSGKRDSHDAEVTALFDGDSCSACAWAFESGLELVVTLQQPVDLGFIEVANYSLGKRTHCGAKSVEVFLSQSQQRGEMNVAAQFAKLWDRDDGFFSMQGLVQITPDGGIALRKAPAQLVTLRYQSFDLSLVGGLGGGGVTQSMSQSMVIRATSAMRRARMSSLPIPEWLEAFQPQTPLLPVAYVFKVAATIVADTPHALKAQLKLWTMDASRVCTFYGDDCSPIPPGTFAFEGLVDIASSSDAVEGMQQAIVSLFAVADAPQALAATTFNVPLSSKVAGAAWVESICMCADDTIIFQSEEQEAHPAVEGAVIRPVIFFSLDEKLLADLRGI